jgi:F-type H+-transporting ATPase subunit epsilon
MAAEKLILEICAPARRTIKVEADAVLVPGADGVFTVQKGHTIFLTTLAPGVLEVTNGEAKPDLYALSGGFAEVREDHVLILADAYEHGDNVDLERAEAARERAEARLDRPSEDIDIKRAELAVARATARIHAHTGEGY